MQAGRSVNREVVNEDGQVYGCLPLSSSQYIALQMLDLHAHIPMAGDSERVVINLLTVQNKGLHQTSTLNLLPPFTVDETSLPEISQK